MIPLHASLSIETLQSKLEAPGVLSPAVQSALEWAGRYRMRDGEIQLGTITPKLALLDLVDLPVAP